MLLHSSPPEARDRVSVGRSFTNLNIICYRSYFSRWNRFILYGDQNDAMEVDNEKCFTSPTRYSSSTKLYPVLRSPHTLNTKTFSKPKKAAPITSLNAAIHESEINFQTGIQACHRFEVGLTKLSLWYSLKE